jgi:hypothetical protein
MLTVEKFKVRLKMPNHPDWLLVGVDSKDEKQLYLLSNGGMGNINCAPIEQYAAEIKTCAREMILLGELFLKENEKSVRIGHGRRVYSYSLKLADNFSQASSTAHKMYFSSLFIRWQRTQQISDKCAQGKLGLTADEFHKFREDELPITPSLINKLAEVTGGSKQMWKNRWEQKQKNSRKNNENI